MARFSRLEVLNAILQTGLLPLFYHDDADVAIHAAQACARSGARLVEFTNRGENAFPVFTQLIQPLAESDPGMIFGVGSVIDAPTAALFISAGANFVVGPSFNPEVARLCNRRKIAYFPGCATATEISAAEEWGVEICKIFPGQVGGPGFIKAILAPMPWSRLMPTGGVEATAESVSSWIKAGAAAVGMGSNLVSAKRLKEGDFQGIARAVEEVLSWIHIARN